MSTDLTASSATMTRNRDFVRVVSRCGTVKGNALRQYARLIDAQEELLNANWSGGIDGGSHSSVSSSSTVENRELTQAPLMAVSVGVRSGKRLLRRTDKAFRAGGIRDNPFSRGWGGRKVLRQVTRNDDDLMNYSLLGIDESTIIDGSAASLNVRDEGESSVFAHRRLLWPEVRPPTGRVISLRWHYLGTTLEMCSLYSF